LWISCQREAGHTHKHTTRTRPQTTTRRNTPLTSQRSKVARRRCVECAETPKDHITHTQSGRVRLSWMCVFIHVCIGIYIYKYVSIIIYMCIYMCVCVFVCACVCVLRVCVYTHTHTHIYMYIYLYIGGVGRVHAQRHPRRELVLHSCSSQ